MGWNRASQANQMRWHHSADSKCEVGIEASNAIGFQIAGVKPNASEPARSDEAESVRATYAVLCSAVQ